ncbi:RICIN domain-containing protein [Streptomyces sp. NBC_00893]|uniref:RICIN domain-containing protein n=1 Tax=Streptomyces sp. NBC_00893 TaxID=2975862 RepID=UPI002251F7C9|nr:RICIN domain-containing protein [Streptomyces sp. NBC_00893]MCX4852090.1 RICIN domain-containing protein [Streptomyces sp. NBC_00893]
MGRPQGELRSTSEAGNALARFLRELTDGMSLRELAERYEGGKTLWGEYRSGEQIVPLTRLNSVVKDRYRDARGREKMLATARELHGLALTAEAEARPAMGLDEALQQADRDIADLNRLIKVLVAQIDVLQERAQVPAPGVAPGPASEPVETIATQLEQLRQHVAEAQDLRAATLKASDEARSEVTARDDDLGAEAGPGTALVGSLTQLHDTAAQRRQDVLALWDGEEVTEEAAPGSAADGPGNISAAAGTPARADTSDANAADSESAVPGGTNSRVVKPEAPGDAGDPPSPHGPVPHGGSPQDTAPAGHSTSPPDGEQELLPGARRDPGDSARTAGRPAARWVTTGAALALLAAAGVAGGMFISYHQDPSADARGPESRLEAPPASTGPSNGPGLDLPGARSAQPSHSATPDPSGPDGSGVATPASKPLPKATPSASAPGARRAPAAVASARVPGEARAWVNTESGQCLEVRHDSVQDGATANQWTCNKSATQRWKTTNPGGWGTVVNANSGKCLEIRHDSVQTGATANQWACNKSSTQNWRWQAQPGGGWSLVNANSKQCLSITVPGSGAVAEQEPCDATPAQTWH